MNDRQREARGTIESLKSGDAVSALQADQTITIDNIHAVFVTENQLWKVSTDSGDIITTKTQPLCLSFGRIIPVERLQIGDELLQYRNGKIRTVNVQAIEMTDRHEDVFNLILTDAVFFVANNFVARSKPPAESGQQEIADHRHNLSVKKQSPVSLGLGMLPYPRSRSSTRFPHQTAGSDKLKHASSREQYSPNFVDTALVLGQLLVLT